MRAPAVVSGSGRFRLKLRETAPESRSVRGAHVVWLRGESIRSVFRKGTTAALIQVAVGFFLQYNQGEVSRMSIFCKLQNCKIQGGECYDIQMVRNRYMKLEVLPAHISLENADNICTFCKYNQLPESHELTDVLYYVKNELSYPSQINQHGFIIRFHDGFIFEYKWNELHSYINGKRFYEIELADIEDWVRQFAGGYDVIIQYKKRFLNKIPFRLVKASEFKLKQPIRKSIEKIFTVSEVIYENKFMN